MHTRWYRWPQAIPLLVYLLAGPAALSHAESLDEPPSLRDRLTVREDENRTEDPVVVEILGRPLALNMQYEIAAEGTEQLVQGDPPDGESRILLGNQLEPELFYEIGPVLSLFAQVAISWEQDLLGSTRREVSDFFVERGEMWIHAQELFAQPISLEIGRLDFEDDRLWWWDRDLDAIRWIYEGDRLEIAIATAREMAPRRSDRSFVDSDDASVFRLITEISWEWADEQSLQLFLLFADDHSRTHRVGDVVRREREDDSDGRLTWAGLRLSGALDRAGGIFGYWADAAFVTGKEEFLEFADVSAGLVEVSSRRRRDVIGWGLDVGGSWLWTAPYEPRLTLGYAIGSGDSNPRGGEERAFRQSGLHENSAGFGGVRRFNHYGILLEPELSNLMITTAGIGISILESSSIDLVHHYYRQLESAESLRNVRLEGSLTGFHHSVGHGLDLIVGIEEWTRVEIELSVSAFRAGNAWGNKASEWAFGGLAAFRFAF